MMTNRERVLASLNHRQPDRVPYHIGFTKVAHAKMVEYYGEPSFAEKLGNCFTFLGTGPPDGWKEVEPDISEDEFGVRWNRSIDKDIGTVCNQVITKMNLEDYEFPDPHDTRRWAYYPAGYGLKAALRTDGVKAALHKGEGSEADTSSSGRGRREAPGEGEDGFLVANIGFSLFERAWTLFGMENLLMAMVEDPAFVHRLLDRILEHNLALIEHACSYDIDAMMFGDDWGSQRGLIMGARLWNEFIKPRVAAMYRAVHATGKSVLIHSCGKVDELFPDLVEAGVDVFNPFQPEVMDVFEVKKQYGDRLCFYGGISTQKTLPYGTVDDVREEVKRLLGEVGKDGGYFAAPAHSIPADARPENVAAMVEVLMDR